MGSRGYDRPAVCDLKKCWASKDSLSAVMWAIFPVDFIQRVARLNLYG